MRGSMDHWVFTTNAKRFYDLVSVAEKKLTLSEDKLWCMSVPIRRAWDVRQNSTWALSTSKM